MSVAKTIVVILQGQGGNEPALERAGELARRNNGKLIMYLRGSEQIEGMAVLQDPEQGPAIKESLTQDRKAYAEALIQEYNLQGIPYEVAVDWSLQPFEGMISEVLRHGADILIKESRHHSRLSTLIFTPTDWHLIRKCPCPVWLTHAKSRPVPKTILAAVSSVYVESVYQELDAKVLEFAKRMADLTGAEIRVINAYSVVPLGVSLDGTGVYQDEYLLDLEKQHHEKTVELAKAHGIAEDQVETRNGETHLVIADCAREIDADIVVVGTVARKGLSGIFIGNTAEMTLERLDCDIITLKQDAFECPIPKPDDSSETQ